MLFGTSQIIFLYAFYTTAGVGTSGLTVTAKASDPTGAQIGAGNLTLTEMDAVNMPGWWQLQIAALATSNPGGYKATFHATQTTVDTQDLPAVGYAYPWINGLGGVGGKTNVITVNNNVAQPLAGVDVWVTSDPAGAIIVAQGFTNTQGQVTFYLNSGVYFVWMKLAGWNFTNPQTLVVT